MRKFYMTIAGLAAAVAAALFSTSASFGLSEDFGDLHPNHPHAPVLHPEGHLDCMPSDNWVAGDRAGWLDLTRCIYHDTSHWN